MKAQARFLWIGMVGLALAQVSCGGGGDGKTMTCDQACQKMVTECALDTQESCMAGCQEMQPVLADTYWNQMGTCILTTACATLNPDTCFADVVAGAPSTNADQLVSSMCDKLLTCDIGLTSKDECVTLVNTQAGDSLDMLNVLKSSVVSCMSTCLTGLDCAALTDQTGDPMGTCGAQCGLPTG